MVQDRVFGGARSEYGTDPNAIATYIAATVPLYEYTSSSRVGPRILIHAHRYGLFRDGGRELVFMDGRPTSHNLGVQASDVECVIAMMKDPVRADAIRREAVHKASHELVDQSRRLRERHGELLRRFEAARAHAERLAVLFKAQLETHLRLPH